MFFSIGFWASTVVFTKIVRKKINSFIINNYEKLSKKLKMQVDELLDVNFFTKVGIVDYIPILNVLSTWVKLECLRDEYEQVKKDIYREFPVLEYQEKVDKDNINRIYDEEKMYFIGYFLDGKPKNYFFHYDGEEIVVLDSSASIFKNLSAEDNEELLLYLLYAWYNGANMFLNGSNNLDEVFNENLVRILIHKFDGVQLPKNEKEITLTRKRK